jgi:hypothetical protein
MNPDTPLLVDVVSFLWDRSGESGCASTGWDGLVFFEVKLSESRYAFDQLRWVCSSEIKAGEFGCTFAGRDGFVFLGWNPVTLDAAPADSDGMLRVQMEIADARLYPWMAQRAVD